MAIVIDLNHTAPEIISLAKAKKQLQLEIDFTEDDSLIEDYIDAAINEAENMINQEIDEKKFEIRGKSFEDVLSFKKQIITSVDEFTYKDADGNLQTVDPESYSLQTADDFENKIVFNDDVELPAVKEYDPAAVVLKVTVGYASGKVPKAIQKALLLLITNSYEFRTDTVKEKCTAAENALKKYRRY